MHETDLKPIIKPQGEDHVIQYWKMMKWHFRKSVCKVLPSSKFFNLARPPLAEYINKNIYLVGHHPAVISCLLF